MAHGKVEYNRQEGMERCKGNSRKGQESRGIRWQGSMVEVCNPNHVFVIKIVITDVLSI